MVVDMDPRITRLAATQHGVVARWQLLAAGLKPKHVDALLRSGRVLGVSRGVYLIHGAPSSHEADAMAAALRCGPDARVVGERMMAFAGVRGARRDADIHVVTRPGRVVTGVDWPWRQNLFDPAEHYAEIHRIPSFHPRRLLLEFAVSAADADLERVVDAYRWTGRLDGAVALACEHAHHPGAGRLLDSGLVDTGAPESPAERRIVDLMDSLGARCQVWVTPRIRVDFFFDRAGLVIERDGPTHTGPAGREKDGTRDAVLRGLGLAVEHLNAEDCRDLDALRVWVTRMLGVLGDRPHGVTG